MLKNESPLCEIPLVVEIGYGNLCKPMLLVVSLHMPVHPDRAHVLCALQKWHIVTYWWVRSCHTWKFRIIPASYPVSWLIHFSEKEQFRGLIHMAWDFSKFWKLSCKHYENSSSKHSFQISFSGSILITVFRIIQIGKATTKPGKGENLILETK